jgi:hypothetical protein
MNLTMTHKERRAAIRVEVAQELMGNCIAHWSAVWSQEDDKPEPDAAVIAHAEAEILRISEVRDTMSHDDLAQVEALITEYSALVGKLYGVPDGA